MFAWAQLQRHKFAASSSQVPSGPSGRDQSVDQGPGQSTGWLRVLTKDEDESTSKTKTASFKSHPVWISRTFSRLEDMKRW